MTFCVNCGCAVKEDDMYCPKCGAEINELKSTIEHTRKEVYDGEVKKCPNCGEVLKSFEAYCSCCGYELRNVTVSQSVLELSNRIQQLELQKGKMRRASSKNQIDNQIGTIISSFPIPNTKEDITEFLILATSNMDVSKAWQPKVEQAYVKAKTVLSADDFAQVELIYKDSQKRQQIKARKETVSNIKFFGIVGAVILLLILVLIFAQMTHPEKNNNEETRLESIVSEANEAMKNREYKYALRIAESIEYKAFDHERERWWGVKKQSLIDEIIDEAKKSGVELVRPTEASTSEY
ncbi:MAG: zinc ribbon domain-containing protein [Ruminococcus sp.]|nr:zinc ribbon domain-containing protein [Ruminococcus sp.]